METLGTRLHDIKTDIVNALKSKRKLTLTLKDGSFIKANNFKGDIEYWVGYGPDSMDDLYDSFAEAFESLVDTEAQWRDAPIFNDIRDELCDELDTLLLEKGLSKRKPPTPRRDGKPLARITKNGIRVHEAIRQHGDPSTTRRVLVFGQIEIDKDVGYANDLFHADRADAEELLVVLQEFLAMSHHRISPGGARRTLGDDEMDRMVDDILMKARGKI